VGEKIKGVKLEFGGVEKEEEVYKLLAFLPVLNSAMLPGPGTSRKVQD
jgi:cytochrome c2